MNNFELNEFDVSMLCGGCPEQYEIYRKGKQVLYVRLRYGGLSAWYPDESGESIYQHRFSDNYKGVFVDSEERNRYFNEIYDAYIKHIRSIM